MLTSTQLSSNERVTRHLHQRRRRCTVASLDNYIDVDTDGGGHCGAYGEDGVYLTTNPLGRSLNPNIGSSELLSLPRYRINFDMNMKKKRWEPHQRRNSIHFSCQRLR